MNRIVRVGLFTLAGVAASAQSPVLRPGVSVQMPVTANAAMAAGADAAGSLIVAVTARGDVFLNTDRVTPAQLPGEVRCKTVYLKADARTPYAKVAEVLAALRTAGVDAPVLLTNQPNAAAASYVAPAGLDVLLTLAPDGAEATRVQVGRRISDTELLQRVRRDSQAVLEVDAGTAYADVAHVIDLCTGAGAKVHIAAAGK